MILIRACVKVPQVGVYTELSTDNAGQVSDLMKAVNSIPAYIEKSSHFFTICPPVTSVCLNRQHNAHIYDCHVRLM